MLWTFFRDGRELHYEVRLCTDGPGYELVVKYPDRVERAERFDDIASLSRRAHALQEEFLADGWWVSDRALRPQGA